MSGRDNEPLSRLLARLRDRSARVAIVGLGYVGLPLARACVTAGYAVTGLDIDPAKPAALNAGRSYLASLSDAEVVAMRAVGRFAATTDFASLAEADAIVLCVPTPLHADRSPDLSFVLDTGRAVAARLRPGQLVVLESTTYPGTTLDELKPVLERGSGLRSGADFLLAYSPEREDPGNARFGTRDIPKVVAGDGDSALEAALALYAPVVSRTVPVSSIATAEAVKLTENVFRAVNIALINELKVIYAALGVDIWEVVEAASTKPFGYMPFHPGPGWGGHCIPVDPFYLSWKARQVGLEAPFIERAGEVNAGMPAHVVRVLADALQVRAGRGLAGARVLLLGIAYKKNVDDTRESPAFRLIELLEAAGAAVDYADPFVPEIGRTRAFPHLAGRRAVLWEGMTETRWDAALICTDHDGVDYPALLRVAGLVVDTRNALRGFADRSRVVMA